MTSSILSNCDVTKLHQSIIYVACGVHIPPPDQLVSVAFSYMDQPAAKRRRLDVDPFVRYNERTRSEMSYVDFEPFPGKSPHDMRPLVGTATDISTGATVSIETHAQYQTHKFLLICKRLHIKMKQCNVRKNEINGYLVFCFHCCR